MVSIVVGVVVVLLLLKVSTQVRQKTALDLLQRGAMVIDVRSPAEFQSGHLPAAVNIPAHDIARHIGQQAPRKDQPLLLHCLSGTRSGMATRTLKRMGYTKVFNLGSYGRAARIVGNSQR